MSLEAATIRKNHYILTWCLEFTICSLLLSIHYTVYDFSYIFLQDECIFVIFVDIIRDILRISFILRLHVTHWHTGLQDLRNRSLLSTTMSSGPEETGETWYVSVKCSTWRGIILLVKNNFSAPFVALRTATARAAMCFVEDEKHHI